MLQMKNRKITIYCDFRVNYTRRILRIIIRCVTATGLIRVTGVTSVNASLYET